MQSAMLPVALGTLDQRQRHILIERRLKERPTKLEELASHYGVSAERVRQIENRAFEKLRKAMLVQILNESKGECQLWTWRQECGAMRLDMDVKLDVETELRSDPAIREFDIAVAVNDGVVREGFVRSYGRKRAAEAAAKRVVGVVGVANDIEVRLPLLHQRPDPVIARDEVGH